MDDQVYKWYVKRGNVTIQRMNDNVNLQLDYEGGSSCLFANSDTIDVINLLSDLAKEIWESPTYQRIPYTQRLFKIIANEHVWQIESSKLMINYNENERAVELKCSGSNEFNLNVNIVVEIIQVLEYLDKDIQMEEEEL